MRSVLLSIGGTPPNWVQHNLPWLAMLAVLLGFETENRAETRRLDFDD